MSDNISKHFTKLEMACPASGEVKFQGDFIDRLEQLRESYDKPMMVTSGCRTLAYNDVLKSRGYAASENSFHLIGNPKYGTDTCAVDISRPQGDALHRLVHIATGMGWTVGIAKTFIHLDLRARYTDLPPVVYNY